MLGQTNNAFDELLQNGSTSKKLNQKSFDTPLKKQVDHEDVNVQLPTEEQKLNQDNYDTPREK